MLWKVPLAVAVLAVYYAVIGVAVVVADRPPHRRRRRASSGLFLVTSIASGILVGRGRTAAEGSAAALINVLALPLYLRDLIFLGHIDPRVAARRGRQRRPAGVGVYVVVIAAGMATLLCRYRWVER